MFMLTLIDMNFCIGSTHSNRIMLVWSAPHRYLWPVYGFLTVEERNTVSSLRIQSPYNNSYMFQKQTNKSWLPVQFLKLQDAKETLPQGTAWSSLLTCTIFVCTNENLPVVTRPGGQKTDLGLKVAERFGEKLPNWEVIAYLGTSDSGCF